MSLLMDPTPQISRVPRNVPRKRVPRRGFKKFYAREMGANAE